MTAPKLPPEVEEALSLVLADAPARGTCDELLLRAAIAAHVAPPVSESFDAARDKVVDAAVRWHAAPSYDNASATALLGAVEDYNATRRAEGDSTTKGGARE